MPKPNKQAVNPTEIVLGFQDGGPDLVIRQSDLKTLHAGQGGNKAKKDEVVIDHVKVRLYERLGGVPTVLDVVLDPTKNDGTVYDIAIEN